MRMLQAAAADPLVGRDTALARVDALLGRAPAVLLTGEAGVGKSHLAHAYADRVAARGRTVLRAAGLTGLAERPLGALRPLLGAVVADRTDPAGWAADRLSDAAREGLVVVDDVDALDELSAAALHHLAVAPVRRPSPRLLLTLRTGGVLPQALERLLTAGTVEHLWVPPLEETHVVELVAALLEGPVEPCAARQVAGQSGGNALFARELVRAGLDADSWVETAAGWALREPLDAGHRLRPLIDFRIAALDGAAWELAQALAVAGRLPLTLLLDLDVAAGVLPLQRAGLARSTSHEIALAHPLFVEAVESRSDRDQADRVVKQLLDVGLDRVLPIATTVRITTLALQRNHHIEADRLLRAAEMAMALHDVPLARDLADAACRAGAPSTAAVVAAAAGAAVGDPDAIATLTQLLEHDDPGVRDAATVAFARHRVGREPPDAVLQILPEDHSASSEAMRASGLMRSGRWRAATEAADRALTLAEDTDGWLDAAWIGCVLHTWGGDVPRGLELARTGLARIEDGVVAAPQVPVTLAQVGSIAAALAGQPGLSRQLAATEMAGADSGYHRGNRSVRLGMHALMTGRVLDAVRDLSAGVAELSAQDPLDLRAWALSYLAQALAMAGRADQARETAARARAALPPGQVTSELAVAQGEAWATAASGDAAGAGATLAALADRWEEASACVCLVAVDLARCGDVETADRLLGPAPDVSGSPALAAAAEAVAAAAAGDTDRALAAAGTLQRLGLRLWAADLLAVASRRVHRTDARRLQTTAYAAAMTCPGADTPALATLDVTLTATQRRVAELAARGMSNRAIGETLGTSPRTAATHLHRVYRTLDVHDRAELARLLGVSPSA